MSPRVSALLTGLVLIGLTSLPAAAKENEKNVVIRFYQEHLSGIDGNRCPMTPSCSEYAAQAIQKHGPVLGWIMACDRLLRCGRDEVALSPKVNVNGQVRVADPVEANDFWWFLPQKETP